MNTPPTKAERWQRWNANPGSKPIWDEVRAYIDQREAEIETLKAERDDVVEGLEKLAKTLLATNTGNPEVQTISSEHYPRDYDSCGECPSPESDGPDEHHLRSLSAVTAGFRAELAELKIALGEATDRHIEDIDRCERITALKAEIDELKAEISDWKAWAQHADEYADALWETNKDLKQARYAARELLQQDYNRCCRSECEINVCGHCRKILTLLATNRIDTETPC